MRPCLTHVVASAALTLMACGGASIPPHLESNFIMASDALSFPNFASGYSASVFDAEGAVRMFGPGVCVHQATPCVLTPSARAFVNKANEAMAGGRCEGFAVLAPLLESKQVDPVDFGGLSGRDLVLANNPQLQRELAYWFATQLVPEVVAKSTQSFSAKDVMPFLAKALAKSSTEHWRLGIVKKRGAVISAGHSLTPVGYFEDAAKGVYQLRVYDNNRPDQEHLLSIDTVRNRWEFEASPNPSVRSSLYFGDDSNDNKLYFAPVSARVGTLPCSFCPGSSGTVQVQTSGGAQARVTTGGGTTGVVDGGLVAAKGGAVTPTFHELGDGETSFALSVETEDSVQVDIANPGAGERETGTTPTQSVAVIGAGYAITAEGLLVTGTDQLTVSPDGTRARYDNNSQSVLTLTSEVQLADGRAVSVSTRLDGTSAAVETNVATDGTVSVVTEGALGAGVTVAVTRTDTDGNSQSGQLTYVSGDAGVLTLDTSQWSADAGLLSGTVTNDGQVAAVDNACLDGRKDGRETDVDCGGPCGACALGLACSAASDCQSGSCHATGKTCVATACADGARDGVETDVDCGGGTCSACSVGLHCQVDADCAQGGCRGGVCVATSVVGVALSGLPSGGTLTLQDNGGDDLVLTGDGSFAFPTKVNGGFAVTIAQQPVNAQCVFVGASSGTASASSLVTVQCVATFAIGVSLGGLPSGASLTLQDNGTDELVLTGDGSATFSTRVTGAFSVTIAAQPASGHCAFVGASSGTAGPSSLVTVQCVATHAIGGTVTGLPSGGSVTLQDNGADDLTVLADGAFTFGTRLAEGASYAVTVSATSATVHCTATNAAGAVGSADVTTVVVSCVSGFSIGGTLSGLTGGTQLVLTNNGGDPLLLSSNGPFTFASPATTYAVAILSQPDVGRCTLSAASGVASADVTTVQASCVASGTFDTSFNGTGTYWSNVSSGYHDFWNRGQLNPDNSSVWVGLHQIGATTYGWIISKLTSGGTLDTSFAADAGTPGYRLFSLPNGARAQQARAIHRTAGGSLIAGPVYTGGAAGWDCGLLALTASGAVDTTFGTNGLVSIDLGGDEYCDDMQLAADGTISLAGHQGNGTAAEALILRLTAAGAVDTSFGSGGVARWVNPGVDDELYSLAVDPALRWTVAVGMSGTRALVLAVDGTGQLLSVNGTSVVLTPDFTDAGVGNVLQRVVLDEHRATAAGWSYSASTQLYAVTQVDLLTGAPAPGFGDAGVALIDHGGARAFGLAPRPSGGFLICGVANMGYSVVALDAHGALDTRFATSGFFEDKAGYWGPECHDLAFDSNGMLLTGGSLAVTNPDLGAVRIVP